MAGFLDYGTGKGLAVAHDWGKDMQNLFQSEALKARDQQEKEQKTAYFAKQLQEGKAVAPANTKRLQDFYVQHNKKIADFVIKNPNFETDVTKMTEFLNLTDQYINNDIIREDQQVQGEFAKLKGAINSGKLRDEERFAEMQKYNDYKDGKVKDPYIFIEPQRTDVEKTIVEISKNLPTETYTTQNKDGSENQVRKVKFNPGESYDTVSEEILASDPEAKWQIETGYKSSPFIQQLYKTPAKFLAAKLRQRADSYNVRSNQGTSNKSSLYPNYDADLFKPMQNMDPNADFQVLGESNPNLIALTPGGQTKGNVPIRAGGEYFNVMTNQNNPDGTPVISKVHVRHNMQIMQTYRPIGVKGVLQTEAFVNITVPFGDEELSDKGETEYYDILTGTTVRKKSLYVLPANAAEETAWKVLIADNKKAAESLSKNYQDAGLRPKKSVSEGFGYSAGTSSLHPPMIYQGTILMDANLSEQSVRAYQSQFNTPGQMDDWGGTFNITKLLNQNINNTEAFINLSKSNPVEAARVVTSQLMSDPVYAKSKPVVTQNSVNPWIYDVKTPGESQVEWYNIRTRKFE